MKGQLRAARQQEHPEEYGSEKIETAAEGVPSAAVSTIVKLRFKKKAVEERAREAEVKTKDVYLNSKRRLLRKHRPKRSFRGNRSFKLSGISRR